MQRIPAQSSQARTAEHLIQGLQSYFVTRLNDLSRSLGENKPFEAVEWFRDEGRHGGGVRYEARDDLLFNRGSVNYSQVHYDDELSKKLSSATAISTIIHPRNPLVPSMHMHISWTEMRDGSAYWRIMADLNPSNPFDADKEKFESALQSSAHDFYLVGKEQGERYFYIPALGRHRGISHFYLENFYTDDPIHDENFARHFGEKVIETYIAIISDAIQKRSDPSQEAFRQQLDYHTLYLLQVLTLDRGTTSGLLIHDQNDIGIMGSLPSHVSVSLLASWVGKLPEVQNDLLRSIIQVLESKEPSEVDEEIKCALAAVVREHYRAHPEALVLQASGDIIPPTVKNHQ